MGSYSRMVLDVLAKVFFSPSMDKLISFEEGGYKIGIFFFGGRCLDINRFSVLMFHEQSFGRKLNG